MKQTSTCFIQSDPETSLRVNPAHDQGPQVMGDSVPRGLGGSRLNEISNTIVDTGLYGILLKVFHKYDIVLSKEKISSVYRWKNRSNSKVAYSPNVG